MIASVPESKTMGVYNAFPALVDKGAPPYLVSTANEAGAKAAYAALLDLWGACMRTRSRPTCPRRRLHLLASSVPAAVRLRSSRRPLTHS